MLFHTLLYVFARGKWKLFCVPQRESARTRAKVLIQHLSILVHCSKLSMTSWCNPKTHVRQVWMNTNADFFGFNLDYFSFESINKTSFIHVGSTSVVYTFLQSILNLQKFRLVFVLTSDCIGATPSYYEISGIFQFVSFRLLKIVTKDCFPR
jgi:hypothetical protein